MAPWDGLGVDGGICGDERRLPRQRGTLPPHTLLCDGTALPACGDLVSVGCTGARATACQLPVAGSHRHCLACVRRGDPAWSLQASKALISVGCTKIPIEMAHFAAWRTDVSSRRDRFHRASWRHRRIRGGDDDVVLAVSLGAARRRGRYQRSVVGGSDPRRRADACAADRNGGGDDPGGVATGHDR